MRILIVTPAMTPPHGGLRIINEWANRLAENHEVVLYPMKRPLQDWFNLSSKVTVSPSYSSFHINKSFGGPVDCLIITSPHGVAFGERQDRPRKVFLFMQMLEHLFRPNDLAWQTMCAKFYSSKHPLISISKWNIRELERRFGRRATTHYVGNGVSLTDFPIDRTPKDNRTVLIEGLEGYNPTKDTNGFGIEVARRLTRAGYKVLAYSQLPAKPSYLDAVREYHCCPSLAQLNDLYRRATILVKASKYDARACAPMEAMTKGTVTARALIEGDDDLVHDVNCLRSGYSLDGLYNNVHRLLKDVQLRMRLSEACFKHVQELSWDHWMPQIEKILCR